MEIQAIQSERRNLRRLQVHDNAIAVIQSTPAILLGQITDISMRGLSFSYMHNDKKPEESSVLDIFIPDEKLHIKGLPFRTIADGIVPNDNPYSTVIMNRRRVQFHEMSDHQKSQLKQLLHLLVRENRESGCLLHSISNLAQVSA